MFIGVYVYGGITNHIDIKNDLSEVVSSMKRTANELGLDPAEDDFRIFNDKGVEVYSYTSDEELQENNWMEVFDQQSERIVVVDRTVEQGISDGDGI